MVRRRSSNESAASLYMRLGLDLTELEEGFVDAQRTVRDNMTRLQRENTIIDLQMEVDLSGVDDAEQILSIRTAALNRQLENQQTRVRLATAELRNMTESTGENSDQTQRARLALEQERLALVRLENQLRNLNESQGEANAGTQSFMDRLSELGGRIAPVIAAITATMTATKELIDKFRELQTQAYELNLPFQATKEMLRQMRLAGGDIGDFEGYIRGISDAYVKGEWDDPEFLALSKYGAKLTDATGRLKDFKELTEEVYQAYVKAKAAGEEIEFLQLTGGESGIRDAIQYFERYAEAKEDAAKIFDSGIDPAELHEAERALNLVTEQFGELKDAVVSLLIPEVTSGLTNFFAILHDGTKFIVENREQLQPVKSALTGFLSDKGFSAVLDSAKKLFTPDDVSMQKQFGEALKGTTKAWSDFEKETNDADKNPLSQYALKRIKEFKDELEEVRVELDYAGNEYQQAKEKLDLWRKNELTDKLFVSDDERIAIEELYSAKLEQIEQARADKLDEIRSRIDEGDRTALENKLATLEEEKEEWRALGMEEEEIVSLSQRRINQIYEESMRKTRELIQETADLEYSLTHDAFEKQIHDLERWKDAQLEKAETAEEVSATIANAAMKEAETFEREMDRIQGRIESAQDRLARLTLSQYDNDVRNAYKQFQKDVADNVPQDMAQAIFDATMRQINRRAAEDKSGKYKESPDKKADAGYLIEFNRAAEKSTKSLIDMDARQLALQATMERAAKFNSDITNQAMEKVRAIEAQRVPEALPQSASASTTPGFDIIYGDQVYSSMLSQAETANRQVSQVLSDITRNAGEGTQNVTQQPQQNINVSPNINIDLGGAYVFDDAMKERLTNDIANQVADGIRKAFEQGIGEQGYGYAN